MSRWDRLARELAVVVALEIMVLLVRARSIGRFVVTVAVVGVAFVALRVLLGRRLSRQRVVARKLLLIVTVVQVAVIIAELTDFEWWLPLAPALLLTLAQPQRRNERDVGTRTATRRMALTAATAVLIGVGPVFSLGTTLVRPSTDPVSLRTVEWVRLRGGQSIVNGIEHWWYSRHPPRVGGSPQVPITPIAAPTLTLTPALTPTTAAAVAATDSTKPTIALTVPAVSTKPTPVPTTAVPVAITGTAVTGAIPPVRPLVPQPLPGEGQWTAVVGTSSRPAIAVTRVRPDSIHTSVVVSVARMDPTLVRFRLHSGTEDPGGTWPDRGQVPHGERSKLLAAFNSGFRQREAGGGYWVDGHEAKPLVDGAASFVIRKDGTATVADWGRDAKLGPDIASVRQNLRLIVDAGTQVGGLELDANRAWGRTVGHRVLVWRSGIGVAKDGALLYVGGPGMSIKSLADVLVAAGAVRGMELDINSSWVAYFLYRQTPAGPAGTKLLPNMRHAPDRYLRAQSRDFFAVLAR